jgi:hypothetical protein
LLRCDRIRIVVQSIRWPQQRVVVSQFSTYLQRFCNLPSWRYCNLCSSHLWILKWLPSNGMFSRKIIYKGYLPSLLSRPPHAT